MQWWLSRLKLMDWWIIASVLLLMAMGVMMLWSMSAGSLERGDALAMIRFRHQASYLIISALLIIVGAALVDLRSIEQSSLPLFIGTLLLLWLVLLFGETIRGTKGWFSLGSFSFQPVEFAKVGYVLFFASILKRWARRMKELRALLVSAIGMALVGVLVLLQPDVGSFFVFIATWIAMVLIVGPKRSHLIMIVLLAALSAVVVWNAFLPYQRDRLRIFLDPNSDPLGRGYQLRQSIIAVGSGGLFGRGLGFGSQSQLEFLPERQTDFLFAVLSEELGFAGVMIFLLLWAVVLMRPLLWAQSVTDDFALFVLIGLTATLFIQVALVVSMNIGLFPITGLTLPFLSYGGSSMIASSIMIMIIEAIIVHSRRSGWAKKYQ